MPKTKLTENLKEKHYKEFCLIFKKKLNELTRPVINDNNRSYEELCDVITNIILFELNIDREPWDEIKFRDVQYDEFKNRKQILAGLDVIDKIKILLDDIESRFKYLDYSAHEFTEKDILKCNLFAALRLFLKYYND